MHAQYNPDQWQIDDDIPVYDGYYGLTITDHVREMVQRRMAPTEYAAEVAYMWSEMTDTWVVRNGDGTQHYLVSTEPDRERCTCPDFQHHGKPLGLPCKHIMAAQIIDAQPKGE